MAPSGRRDSTRHFSGSADHCFASAIILRRLTPVSSNLTVSPYTRGFKSPRISTCLRTRTRLSTSSSKWWAKIPTRSISEWKCPPTWANSKNPMLSAWVCRCPHCGSFSTVAESTMMKHPKPWKWNKTTSLRSTRNRQEAKDEDRKPSWHTRPVKKYTTLTCILFLNIFAFPQHKVSRIKTICPTTQKYYAKLCLARIMLICFDDFFCQLEPIRFLSLTWQWLSIRQVVTLIFLSIIQNCQLTKVSNDYTLIVKRILFILQNIDDIIIGWYRTHAQQIAQLIWRAKKEHKIQSLLKEMEPKDKCRYDGENLWVEFLESGWSF